MYPEHQSDILIVVLCHVQRTNWLHTALRLVLPIDPHHARCASSGHAQKQAKVTLDRVKVDVLLQISSEELPAFQATVKFKAVLAAQQLLALEVLEEQIAELVWQPVQIQINRSAELRHVNH
jgi:hypothetical protein